MKVITEVENLYQKTVILRTDLNVPLRNGVVEDDTRILSVIPSINYLLKCKCKVIIVSHLGRPKGTDDSLSLSVILDTLSKAISTKVLFAPKISDIKPMLGRLDYGEVILLENIRFYPEEERNDVSFAEELAGNADLYVNDAFSVSHRNHASIASLPLFLPSSAGLSLVNEVNALNSVCNTGSKSKAAIIGGAKISTKIGLIRSLASKVDYVIIGGALANNVLRARNFAIGESLYEPNVHEDCYSLDNVIVPCDVVTATGFAEKGHVCDIRSVPSREKIFDIGPASILQIKNILYKCDAVLWNGPLGLFEEEHFNKGTKDIVTTIMNLTQRKKITSVVGGGDSVSAINKFGVPRELFSHVSTAGGAFLEWFTQDGLVNLSLLQ